MGLITALSVAGCGSAGDDAGSRTKDASADGGGQPASDPVGADEWPLTIDNCGIEVTLHEPPQRVVTLNKPATEILLALGLRDRVAAVAGAPDDTVAAEVADDFAAVDVLVEKDYPSFEALVDTEPDFVYAAYPSAFRDDGVGSRETFADLGVPTYLSEGRCENRDEHEPISVEDIWSEITEIGRIFGVGDEADRLVADQREQLDQTLASLDGLPARTVYWWDMRTDTPFVGACCGAPGMIIDALGFQNIFDDLPGHWADANWEQVVERDPDMIVIADFGDGDAAEKLEFITSDPTLSQLRAVRNDALVTLPFAMTTPGIQTVDAIETLAQAAAEAGEEGE
ncbi:ABC transporter substrate-binding protein [Phytoactinopolyspora halotolerans]|uniref:ABC transporter substrate-binding protein n=1 Tax=Phytoactinopolyspora halotolerans TaxID=1981512 RepID=A0A6L9S3R9_9ACTN|nr:ABC transporter substrate-binding protein [Phytoactinopolyspora halotolerans]